MALVVVGVVPTSVSGSILFSVWQVEESELPEYCDMSDSRLVSQTDIFTFRVLQFAKNIDSTHIEPLDALMCTDECPC